MPNNASTEKRLRQTEKRTLRNKTVRTSMRTYQKKIWERIEEGDRAGAEALLPVVQQKIDKAAKHNILHANTAANQKSRIAKRVQALS